jgi:hypothetical protein
MVSSRMAWLRELPSFCQQHQEQQQAIVGTRQGKGSSRCATYLPHQSTPPHHVGGGNGAGRVTLLEPVHYLLRAAHIHCKAHTHNTVLRMTCQREELQRRTPLLTVPDAAEADALQWVLPQPQALVPALQQVPDCAKGGGGVVIHRGRAGVSSSPA